MATGFLLSENPKEVHAEAFDRVTIGGAFTVSGVPDGGAEVEVGVSVSEPGEVVTSDKKEDVVKTDLGLSEDQIKQVLVSKTYVHNPELAISQYRKTIKFDLDEEGGLNKAISTIANLLNYHGSKQFNVDVVNTDDVNNTITVVIGFSPDLRVKDENGYATRLNLNSYTQEEMDRLVNRYNYVLKTIGYNIVNHSENHVRVDNLRFKRNYDNGRKQYEFNHIMNVIDKHIKADLDNRKGKNFSLKITDNPKTQYVSVTVYMEN